MSVLLNVFGSVFGGSAWLLRLIILLLLASLRLMLLCLLCARFGFLSGSIRWLPCPWPMMRARSLLPGLRTLTNLGLRFLLGAFV